MSLAYRRRNKWIAKNWVAKIRPIIVAEFASGDPDMAALALKRTETIQSYLVSDIDDDLVAFMRRWLCRDRRASVVRMDANSSAARKRAAECDLLICPSLEHFEKDREVLDAAKPGTRIIFSARTFGYHGAAGDCHLRQFDAFDQVIDRYGHIVSIDECVWHGSGRRWIVLATARNRP